MPNGVWAIFIFAIYSSIFTFECEIDFHTDSIDSLAACLCFSSGLWGCALAFLAALAFFIARIFFPIILNGFLIWAHMILKKPVGGASRTANSGASESGSSECCFSALLSLEGSSPSSEPNSFPCLPWVFSALIIAYGKKIVQLNKCHVLFQKKPRKIIKITSNAHATVNISSSRIFNFLFRLLLKRNDCDNQFAVNFLRKCRKQLYRTVLQCSVFTGLIHKMNWKKRHSLRHIYTIPF